MPSTIQNVRIVGIAASIPQNNEPVLESNYGTLEERKKFIKTTGIENRRVSPTAICTSDLACAAAEKLLEELQWDRNEIDLLIFVSQSPDYMVPATAIVLQNRLKLPHSSAAFDVNLGCSGYTYGLSIMSSMISAGKFRKGLLLVGDTSARGVKLSIEEGVAPLFGDAATATALEWCEDAPPIYSDLYSDGSGYEAIMHFYGAARNPFPKEKFEYYVNNEGNVIIDTQFRLDGLEIFNFSIREVPPAIKKILAFTEKNIDDIDAFLFHQANMLMNEIIRKNLKLPLEKVPYTLKEFGNTSSATIPLTLLHKLSKEIQTKPMTLLMCGFGVGFSWGTVLCQTNGVVCPDIVEL